MKKFSDKFSYASEDAVGVIDDQVDLDSKQIPARFIEDSQWIGYENPEIQAKVYWSALTATLHGPAPSVLDVGCGRGDFGNYVLNIVNNQIDYTGIDANQFAIMVGETKYKHYIDSNQNYKFNLEHGVFPQDIPSDNKYNWIFHNTNLTVDYGLSAESPEDYLKHIIESSLDMCIDGVVLMLLNTNQDFSDVDSHNYITYSYEDITDILFPLGVKFAIDNTYFKNIFKVIIFKEQL